ncbi:hypothetical protein [Legionella yabuuchiae]|uniref:hypothetical protein n=1 Tax=Legionella yabuuchiae TaxID=376727 RepID=UPI001054C7A0|nr:hypothetical protein [Legionella yabuuchiae]
MTVFFLRRPLLILALLFSCSIHADELEKPSLLPTETPQASWVFSGIINNEEGDQFGYLFQVQRDNTKFHALAAIVDANTHEVLIFEESSEILENPDPCKWQIGRAFLTFNPINENWVFGLKNKGKKGFNFKVDMLLQQAKSPKSYGLRSGVELMINQTGRINGHINLGQDQKEQFVTANNAWFSHVWLTEKQDKPHFFSNLLCHFTDGSGLYSANMKEEDVHQGAIVGLCDREGNALTMSQFIDIKENENNVWHIRIPSPKMTFELSGSFQQSDVLAGFISKGEKEGFCLLSKEKLG